MASKDHSLDSGIAQAAYKEFLTCGFQKASLHKIAENAGFEGSVVAEKIKAMPAGQGLDSATGTYGDMIEMGVLDPVKVARVTLQNAASIAGLILITEATVSDEPKNTNIEDAIAAAAAQGGQGGGMY